MSKFLSRLVLFLGACLATQLSACGKKGTPMPPEDCDFISSPQTLEGEGEEACLPEKFPAIYPPE